ncbi:MAG TPA: HAD hydrolase-like protein [Candidatus Acidoferrales bacterium]|nr:HAD hydrolase-like protein [Candidatus Acidoferrales bacterium]
MKTAKFPWHIIIFDVDGVLVDVRESYQRTVLETVRHFTGKRVTRRELHQWKNRPGFNDDWKLTHAWVRELGAEFSYEEVKKQFEKIYWGHDGDGNVSRERWLLSHQRMRALASRAELAIFTGRTNSELDYTLGRFSARTCFKRIVTVESVAKPKPDPEGLTKILDGRSPEIAIYLGDNIDDALAARSARVAFLGVLPKGSQERRIRAAKLRDLDARGILGDAGEIAEWFAR